MYTVTYIRESYSLDSKTSTQKVKCVYNNICDLSTAIDKFRTNYRNHRSKTGLFIVYKVGITHSRKNVKEKC